MLAHSFSRNGALFDRFELEHTTDLLRARPESCRSIPRTMPIKLLRQ